MNVAILLFDNFETLDVFGPVEIFGGLPDNYKIHFYSLSGGLVENTHAVSIMSRSFSNLENSPDIFIIPGGYGTRGEVNNIPLIDKIKEISELSKYVLTVC